MPEGLGPIEQQLRGLAADAARAAHGLPAEEVRARGQRRQLRVAVAAALAALTVIGSGAIAFGATQTTGAGGNGPASDPPPTGGWLQEIPDELVIDADPPPDDASAATQGPNEALGVVDASICGEPGIDGSPEPVDQLGFRTALQWRGLLLFASDVDANTAYQEFISHAQACPTSSQLDSSGEVPSSTWSVGLDEIGHAIITEKLRDDPVVFYYLVKRGNSLAVVRTDPLDSQTSEAEAVHNASEQGAQAAAGLADQMCVFTSEGCRRDVPFPDWMLNPGLPDPKFLLGSWRTVQTFTDTGDSVAAGLCQQESLTTLGAFDVVGRVYEGTTGGAPGGGTDPAVPQRMAIVHVASFPDDATARDAYAEVAGWIEDCPAAHEQFSDVDVLERFPERAGDSAFSQTVVYGPTGVGEPVWLDAYGLVLDKHRLAVVSVRVAGSPDDWLSARSSIMRVLTLLGVRLGPYH